jgi:predicted RNA methylase
MGHLRRVYRGLPADIIPVQYQALLLLDERRMTAFQRAIDHVVTPGMRVLDLGAGTGVLSYFAALRGAEVIAVERDERVLAVARDALAAATGDAVRVVHADAREYLPAEPVDVVICEMLHVGLLRERQVEVIAGFRQRYLRQLGEPLPVLLPAACVQAIQPVEQDFAYFGYRVPAPVFQVADHSQPRTREIAPPVVFQQFEYRDSMPATCTADLVFVADRAASLNAVRVITKNLLAVCREAPGSIDWTMNYLVVPLPKPLDVRPGDDFRISFTYRPGDEIWVLTDSLSATAGRPA